MTVLIVAIQTDIAEYFRELDESKSWNIIQYQHPLKAMDNIEELRPDIVFWSYDDFPRHWKSFIGSLLNEQKRIRFYLVSDGKIPEAEIEKSKALVIEGFTQDGFYSDEIQDYLKSRQPKLQHGKSYTPFVKFPEGRVLIVQQDIGAFPADRIELSRNELRCLVTKSDDGIMPALDRDCEITIIHKSSRIRVSAHIRADLLDSALQIDFVQTNNLYTKLFENLSTR